MTMLLILRQIILIIHILLASIWVGGVLFIGWGVFPSALKSLSLKSQRHFFLKLMAWAHPIFTGLGSGVILTGILLGTLVGPIHNLHDVVGTMYGRIWLTALLIAVFTLVWGATIAYRSFVNVFSDESIWQLAGKGDKRMLNRSFLKITVIESIEVFGFIMLILLMISF